MFTDVYWLIYWFFRLVLGCFWNSNFAGIGAFRGRARHHSQKCCLLDARNMVEFATRYSVFEVKNLEISEFSCLKNAVRSCQLAKRPVQKF